MNGQDYISYRSCGIFEYSVDQSMFALYIRYLSDNCLKQELFSVLNILLEHYIKTPQEKRIKILKLKEIVALCLIYSSFDGSASCVITSWQYELNVLKNVFNFACAYSNKNCGGRNVPKMQKLLNFIVFDYYLQVGGEEVIQAENVVRSIFEGELEVIEEKVYAGVLYGRKVLLDMEDNVKGIIDSLKNLLQMNIADSKVVEKAWKLINTYEALALPIDDSEDPFEKIIEIPVIESKEPMITNTTNNEEIYKLPLEPKPKKYNKTKLALLSSNPTLK